jgi:hypothetical protein
MYKIKNWDEHQPSLRPDRNVIWIKVYRRILEDYDWGNLTDSNKATLIELWLLASENEGNLPKVEEIAYRLRKDKSFINKQLSDLSSFVLPVGNKSATSRQEVGSLEVEVEVDKSRGRVEVDDGFNIFWNMYPRKVAMGKAQIAWKKHKPNIDIVVKTLTWQKDSKQWYKQDGEFIPNPATYINQHRWKDEPTEEVTF